jgi:ABC-2 type transport system permease protein
VDFELTPMGALPLFLQIVIPFLMFMGVTDLLNEKNADNSTRDMTCLPAERRKLYAARILAVETYAAVYLIGILYICVVINQLLGKPLSAEEMLVSLASYALTLIPLAILASFAALIAMLVRGATLTMILLLISYLTLSILPVYFPILNEILFTSYLSWYKLWIGATPGVSKMIQMILIALGCGAAFFTAGSLIFEKRNINQTKNMN